MRTRHADRLWMVAGTVVAALLLTLGWFMFIGPKRSETAELTDQTAAAELRLTSLKHGLAELRTESTQLPRYRAELTRNRQALPTGSGLTDFLRELQAAGDARGVVVSGVIVGLPTQVSAAGAELYALPVTLTAVAPTARLALFLDQLQRVQPRAVLVSSVSAVPEDQNGTLAGPVTLTLSVQVFVAPPDAAALPIPTTPN